jgi:hypothetical protein
MTALLLASNGPSPGARAFLYVLACIAFLVAVILSWIPAGPWPGRNYWAAAVSAGLFLFTLVFAWTAIAAT